MAYSIVDIIAKKRDGHTLTWGETDHFINSCMQGTIREAQTGAFVMACHLKGLNDEEVELLMKAMMISGNILSWPLLWKGSMASLQSVGSTGNKAKLILAPAMAACGLKFPVMSSRGIDVAGGVVSKLSTIPGFDGFNKTYEDMESLLARVGCCVVQQPQDVAPAERLIRDMAALTATGDNNAFKEACMIARVAAMKLNAVVIDIPFGPGEWIKTREDALAMAAVLTKLSTVMAIKAQVVVTRVDHPVGQMIGQTLEVAEAIRCLNGEGPQELHDLVCTLGGHILQEAGKVPDSEKGCAIVAKHIKDGTAKKKFGEMLHAQGVDKSDVRALLKHRKDENAILGSGVLPTAQYVTHLSVSESGYVHDIDMTVCTATMYELVAARADVKNTCYGGGGIQLLTKVKSFLKTGALWAKVHHNTRLTEVQVARLKGAIHLRPDPPDVSMVVEICAVSSANVRRQSAFGVPQVPNIPSHNGSPSGAVSSSAPSPAGAAREVTDSPSERRRSLPGKKMTTFHESTMSGEREEGESSQAATANQETTHDRVVTDSPSERRRNLSGKKMTTFHESTKCGKPIEGESSQAATANQEATHDKEVTDSPSERRRLSLFGKKTTTFHESTKSGEPVEGESSQAATANQEATHDKEVTDSPPGRRRFSLFGKKTKSGEPVKGEGSPPATVNQENTDPNSQSA